MTEPIQVTTTYLNYAGRQAIINNARLNSASIKSFSAKLVTSVITLIITALGAWQIFTTQTDNSNIFSKIAVILSLSATSVGIIITCVHQAITIFNYTIKTVIACVRIILFFEGILEGINGQLYNTGSITNPANALEEGADVTSRVNTGATINPPEASTSAATTSN